MIGSNARLPVVSGWRIPLTTALSCRNPHRLRVFVKTGDYMQQFPGWAKDVSECSLPDRSISCLLPSRRTRYRSAVAMTFAIHLMLCTLSPAQAMTEQRGAPFLPLFTNSDGWTTQLVSAGRSSPHAEPLAAPAQIEYPIVPPTGKAGSQYVAESVEYGNHFQNDRSLTKEQKVSRFRNGPFQGVQISGGTVGGGSADDYFNMDHFMATTSVAIPLGSMENVLMISPSFRADYLRFSDNVDLPDVLQETGVRFFWKAPVRENVSSMIIVTPSIRNDFSTMEGAFRVFGLAMLTWETIPDELSISAGFIYLDRSDFAAMPAAGLTWRPTAEWKMDLQFPQPRLSYRVAKDGARSESWVYLAGGFGGNTWGVSRTSGQTDELTVSDLRLMVGYEKIVANNCGWFAEAGWAFDRSIEYTKVPLTQDFSDALLIRAGLSF